MDKKNGVAKEIRHYAGSLFIFLLVIAIVFILMRYPVLETNKEVVMMLIGTISASIGLVVSTITGSKPDDIMALKNDLEKKQQQIDFLVSSKDDLEAMVISLQKEMLKNQDDIMDKFILKAATEYDEKETLSNELKNGSTQD